MQSSAKLLGINKKENSKKENTKKRVVKIFFKNQNINQNTFYKIYVNKLIILLNKTLHLFCLSNVIQASNVTQASKTKSKNPKIFIKLFIYNPHPISHNISQNK